MTIGIRLMLQGSHFLQLAILEEDAQKLFQAWEHKSVPRFRGRCAVTGVEWMVDAASMVGIHTFDYAELQAAQRAAGQQQPMRNVPPYHYRSGN